MEKNKIAVMQPYVFPYLGYFQLINTVDYFVFYDDVNFIKQGWVNRNRVLFNGQEYTFTIPLKKVSSFSHIKDIEIHPQLFKKWQRKFLMGIEQSYSKAPFFSKVYPLIKDTLEVEKNISSLAIVSVNNVLNYLDIERKTFISSKDFKETKNLERADRLIAICQNLDAKIYYNGTGGKKLYQKDYFLNSGIELNFIEPLLPVYEQNVSDFRAGLSIIDVLMYNSVERVRKDLNAFTLS